MRREDLVEACRYAALGSDKTNDVNSRHGSQSFHGCTPRRVRHEVDDVGGRSVFGNRVVRLAGNYGWQP